MKNVSKCVLPGDLSNITIYYDVADSFAGGVCDEEDPYIEKREPTMEPTAPQELSSGPNLLN